MRHPSCIVLLAFSFLLHIYAQDTRSQPAGPTPEPIDSAAVESIKTEAFNNSQVMDILAWLTDVHGPRLTGSPQFMKAAQWSMKKMSEFGLENVHLEGWGPFGRGWALKRHSLHMTEPQTTPLISYPAAWSHGTNGTVRGEAIYCDAKTDSALNTFKGKLRGKFVLLNEPRTLTPRFEPLATRETDSSLLELANADLPRERRRRFQTSPDAREAALVNYKKLEMCINEGAAALLYASRGDGGTIFVQTASLPSHPDTPRSNQPRPWSPRAPRMLPQVYLSAEHYNRIIRLMERGVAVKLEMNLDVNFSSSDSGYNVIGEIQGSDLKDEIVVIGAHLDSWHGGTGTTDNATGVATCLEAMRILKNLDLKPRRTIRIALWGGEEQGLLGSRAHVRRHFLDQASGETGALSPQGEKFSVYFNNDNGTGAVRGVYMEGNESARSIFRAWLRPFYEHGATTLSLRGTGSSDHVVFNEVGLPGFQFIQDDIEYFTRTWHSTMDVFERAIEQDMKQTSAILAAFAYSAAVRNEKFPRK